MDIFRFKPGVLFSEEGKQIEVKHLDGKFVIEIPDEIVAKPYPTLLGDGSYRYNTPRGIVYTFNFDWKEYKWISWCYGEQLFNTTDRYYYNDDVA